MIQAQPLIVLTEVVAGSEWFQRVLGVRSGHGGTEYEQLLDGDTMVAQLHQWEADEHPALGDRTNPSRGNGVLLWFWTDEYDAVLERVADNDVVILDGPLVNPNSGQREVWVRGPEGYVVVVAGP